MNNKHLSIVGFGNNRDEKDFYPTPPEVTHALFEKEKFDGKVWECACGAGDMSRVIEQYNECYSSDIQKEDWVYGDKGINFLAEMQTHDNIITNPPYRYALDFVQHAKLYARKKIAMLLKLVFLESKSRYKMFQDTYFPLKSVYVFCSRVKIYKRGIAGKNSGLIAYAWYVWDRSYNSKPMIDWIV